MVARLFRAAENIVAAIARIPHWWFAQIARQDTFRAKAVVACVGLLALCVVCSIPVMLVSGPRQVALSVVTPVIARPTSVEVDPPTALAASAPTTVPPSRTPVPPTIAPTVAEPTLAPTLVASVPPPATAAPQPTISQATAKAPAPRPTSVANSTLASPPDLPSAPVVRVVDGDTVDVNLDGQVVRLRLIGIDTPEIVDPRTSIQCFGREASAKAHELLDRQTVTVEADTTQDDVDRYGRLLRYIWLPDGRLFNQEMIDQGYAFEYTYRVPYKYQAEFKQAERDAREQQRGLWSPQTCAGEHRPADAAQPGAVPSSAAAPQPAPSPPPRPPEATGAPAGNCDPAYPDVCIPPPPPDLDCGDIPYRNVRVLPPDPHRFDRDKDGIGCES